MSKSSDITLIIEAFGTDPLEYIDPVWASISLSPNTLERIATFSRLVHRHDLTQIRFETDDTDKWGCEDRLGVSHSEICVCRKAMFMEGYMFYSPASLQTTTVPIEELLSVVDEIRRTGKLAPRHADPELDLWHYDADTGWLVFARACSPRTLRQLLQATKPLRNA